MKKDLKAYAEVFDTFTKLPARKETEVLLDSFLEYLKDTKRTALVGKILRTYEQVLAATNRGAITITTRHKLAPSVRASIVNLFNVPDSVEVIERIDPTLVGGFIAQCGTTYLDCSIKGKLERMKNKIDQG